MKEERKVNIDKLIEAFKTPPFSFILSGNILATIKPQLMKEGFKDFPVFTLVGKSGSGKTSLAIACVRNEPQIYFFTERTSQVKKELLKDTTQKYVILDDLANFNSYASKEKGARFLDEIVRASYIGTMPILVITVEDQVLPNITPSCRSRLLEINVDDIVQNDALRPILDDLQKYKSDLNKLFDGFDEWFKDKQVNFSNKLNIFRKTHLKKMDSRSISIFFAYSLSLELFNDYLTETYRISQILIKNVNINFFKLHEKRTIASMNRKEVVKKIFDLLVKKKIFKIINPSLIWLCNEYCKGNCYKKCNFEEKKLYCEEIDNTVFFDHFYDVRSLILDKEDQSALLIENPKYLYGYPKYCITEPLLIVKDHALLYFMNSMLSNFCCEYQLFMEPFGPKELHHIMYDMNMCMFNSIDKNHKTYIFDYIDYSDTIKVMVIRLTKPQFDILKRQKSDKKQRFISDFSFRKEDYEKLSNYLQKMFASIHFMYGPSTL